MYDHVLLPTDGSDAADRAVGEAIELAGIHGATLHVLHALDVGEMPPGLDESAESAFEQRGRDAVEEVVARAEEAGIDDVRGSLVRGQAHEVIVSYAEDNDVDLIVVGTHGRTGLDRLIMGSVTEKVVRLAPMPVLAVGPPE